MKPRLLIGISILSLILAGAGYWLYQNVERYTRQINTGPKLDVSINPWFAAQAFLKRHQIETHRAMDLHDMLHRLQAQDALVLFNDTPIFDEKNQRLLTEWMENGGHLILAANYEWDEEEETSDDPFLDNMGVRLIYTGDDDDEEAVDDEDENESEDEEDADATVEPIETGAQPDTDQDELTSDAQDITKIANCSIYTGYDLFNVVYDTHADPLRINFGYTYTLEDASQNVMRTAEAEPNGLLEYAVGKGRMTVVLDTDIWSNRQIGDYDHAFLLWHLVNDSPVVWFVANHDSENLIAMLWRTASFLLIGCIALLLVWGWRRSVRFGPLIPDPSPARRQLLEHIEASTLFNWKHQQLEPVLRTLRDDIWLHLNRHHGLDYHEGDNGSAALNKLAELSHQSSDIVQQAMTCPPPQRETNWIELISQLQTIRNAL